MPTALTAVELLDREYLSVRSRILDIAAALDRIGRADESATALADARMVGLRDAVALLTDDKPDRARRVQMIFSDDYDAAWR